MTVFETQVMTWGLESDKYGYKLPIALKDQPTIVEAIEKLASENEVNPPLYGKSKTLYLKLKALSKKQTETLLNKGRQDVKVKFEFTGMFEKNYRKFMCFKVLGLGKIVKDEEVPEDF